jgi:hypothetical protein
VCQGLNGFHTVQELQELIADLRGCFVVYPVADTGELDGSDEPGESEAHLVDVERIELF